MRSKIFTRTVGYWPLQESSGQALDYSGNENHASTTNVSSYGVSGPWGGSAIEFDGTDDYVQVPYSYANLFGTSNFTVALWIKTTSNGRFVDNRDESNGYVGFSIDMSSGKVRFTIDDGSSSESRFKTSQTFNDGNWHHIAVKRVNSDSNGMKIFVDGAEQSISADFSTTIDSSYDISHSDPTEIGAQEVDGGSLSGNLQGKISHVRVWDYPLSEASIRALYNASRGGFSESDSRTL